MDIKKVLGLSNWKEFYTLKPAYKWVIYAFGWLLVVTSLIFLAATICSYMGRDKKIKKKADTIQFGYQKIAYWLGWLFVPCVVLSVFVALGFFMAGYAGPA